MIWVSLARFALRLVASGLLGFVSGKLALQVLDQHAAIFIAGAFGGTLGPILVEMAETLGRMSKP